MGGGNLIERIYTHWDPLIIVKRRYICLCSGNHCGSFLFALLKHTVPVIKLLINKGITWYQPAPGLLASASSSLISILSFPDAPMHGPFTYMKGGKWQTFKQKCSSKYAHPKRSISDYITWLMQLN